MTSSAVRVHVQTGRDRDHGIPPSTRNSFSSSPPTFRNPFPILRNTTSPSPSPPPPRNPPSDLRNTSSPSLSPPPPRNPLPVSRNSPPVS